jgi:hypothetical protein
MSTEAISENTLKSKTFEVKEPGVCHHRPEGSHPEKQQRRLILGLD